MSIDKFVVVSLLTHTHR